MFQIAPGYRRQGGAKYGATVYGIRAGWSKDINREAFTEVRAWIEVTGR